MTRSPIVYQGQLFDSKTSLARHLGVALSVLFKRMQAGIPQDKWGMPTRVPQLREPKRKKRYFVYHRKTFTCKEGLMAYAGEICWEQVANEVSIIYE